MTSCTRREADLRIVGHKVCTDKVAPDPTPHINEHGSEPAQSLLNVSQNEETVYQREEQVDQSVWCVCGEGCGEGKGCVCVCVRERA